MKRVLTLIIAIVFILPGFCQEEADTAKVGVGKSNIVTVTENDEGTNVNVKEDFVIVDETDDTVKVKLGNKAISVYEKGSSTHVEIIEEKDFHRHGWRKRSYRFKAHWSGFEFGLNNLLDPDWQLAGTKPEHAFMDLNTGKSWEWNINFMQFSIPFGKAPMGLVTGMGFKWNNYHFDGNNSIMKDPLTRVIVPKYPPAGITYSKTKLNTTYLTVPLIYEVQFGRKKKGFLSVGVIGDLKLWSNTKVKYYTGSKQKEKAKSDFNLSPLRYHITARAGYKFIKLYANYSMVSFYKKDMGPELYPITIGLTLISFR